MRLRASAPAVKAHEAAAHDGDRGAARAAPQQAALGADDARHHHRRRRGDRDGEHRARAPTRRCSSRSGASAPNLLMVVPGATTAAGVRSGWGGVSTLTVADAEAIARQRAGAGGRHVFRAPDRPGRRRRQELVDGGPGRPAVVLRGARVGGRAGASYDERDEDAANRVAVARPDGGRPALRPRPGPGRRHHPHQECALPGRRRARAGRARRCGARTRTTSSSSRSPPPSGACSAPSSSARST